MAPPIYFFAGRSKADIFDPSTGRVRLAPLESAGLDAVLDGVHERETCHQDMRAAGPGSKSGFLLIVNPPSGETPKRIGYYPQFQRWQEADDDLWIGADLEEPPGPADLLRPGRRHPGYDPTLADGNVWTIPIVRRPAAVVSPGIPSSNLPHDIGWDRSGRFTQTLKVDYQQLWEDTAELCDVFTGEGEFSISIERGLGWAVRLLGLNYRYGRHEQNLLHVVDAQNVFAILSFAVDYPLYRSLIGAEKKTEGPAASPGSSIAPGSPAEPPSIAQAAGNSG